MNYQRPKPDPRDDVKFAAISGWLKANKAKGFIKRDGSVVIRQNFQNENVGFDDRHIATADKIT